MDLKRFSLMTFQIESDLRKKTMTVSDTLQLAKDAGIGYIDVMKVRKKQIAEYQEAMKESGVRINTYIDVISFLNTRSKYRKQICESLDIAKQLKAASLMIVPYGVFDVYRARKIGKNEVIKRMIEGFREAVLIARDTRIRICVETTPHKESCLSGSEDILQILNAVDGLNFVFDTANMLPNGEDPLKAYEILKNKISYVHLKDVSVSKGGFVPAFSEHTPNGEYMECVVWGDGWIPVKQLYENMLKDGYHGLFAIEYSRPSKKACDLKKHADHLNKFFEYLDS